MSPVQRARQAFASRHLEQMLSPYADRSLPVSTLLACDKHVSICPRCRAAADAERRLLRSLRTAATPGLSGRLEAALLDLAVHSAPPVTSGPSQLALVDRCAPARYRSPVRAALLAALVAGASAAAAWSLGVNALGPSARPLQVVYLPASAATAGSTTGNASTNQAASFLSSNHVAGFSGSSGLTTSTAASIKAGPVAPPWPGVPDRGRRSAQSTHE